MIEKSIFFLCIIYSLTTQAQRDGQHVFPTIEADSVVLYILNQHLTHYPKSVPHTLFDSNGLRTDLQYSKRFLLNDKQVTELVKNLTDPSGYADGYHVGFAAYHKVFVGFYQNGKIQNYLYINSLGRVVFEPYVQGLQFGGMSEHLRDWVNAYIKRFYPEFHPIVEYDEERDFFGQ